MQAYISIGRQASFRRGLCILQPDSASQRGALQLLDALDKKGGKAVAQPAYPMPTGFLEDLAARFEQEGLDAMLGPTGAPCSATGTTWAVPAMCTRLSTVASLGPAGVPCSATGNTGAVLAMCTRLSTAV